MSINSNGPEVVVEERGHLMQITLNRPHVINSLDLEMVRLIRRGLEKAENADHIKAVFFQGNGPRGFCAGGDIKGVYGFVQEQEFDSAMRFFEEEYALDLTIHGFSKPIIVLARGITMGGGLGLAAGADMVVVTENSRMAMPESRIGFFPDVGATGWLFGKCSAGYPEFLGLTGYEMIGPECVRLGMATHLVLEKDLKHLLERMRTHAVPSSSVKPEALQEITEILKSFQQDDPPENPDMDEWVQTYFAGKTSLGQIFKDLNRCTMHDQLCRGIFERISERSPTALALTLRLLRHNEGRPLKEVFRMDAEAARFMIRHPDYSEGVRARVIDKDDHPVWNPGTIEEVDSFQMDGLFLTNKPAYC